MWNIVETSNPPPTKRALSLGLDLGRLEAMTPTADRREGVAGVGLGWASGSVVVVLGFGVRFGAGLPVVSPPCWTSPPAALGLGLGVGFGIKIKTDPAKVG